MDVFLKKKHQDHIEDHITAALLFFSPVVNPVVYVAVNALYRKHIYWCFYKFVAFCCAKLSHKHHGFSRAEHLYKVTYNSHSNQDNITNINLINPVNKEMKDNATALIEITS